jgi:hypothetical protein
MALESVRGNQAFEYVPEHLKTEAVCIEAAAHFYSRSDLQEIPKKFLTADFFLKVVEKKGRALKLVPEKYRSKAVLAAALKQDGAALEYVEPSSISAEDYRELCKIAFYR